MSIFRNLMLLIPQAVLFHQCLYNAKIVLESPVIVSISVRYEIVSRGPN